LNVAKYERLLTVPHYRLEDDLVVETSDGSLAAFALCWFDQDGRVGELEPVGTHPDHQRRGLSRAIVTEAVRRLFLSFARKSDTNPATGGFTRGTVDSALAGPGLSLLGSVPWSPLSLVF
jgi:GNAT superfamily N-acetyltransferase